MTNKFRGGALLALVASIFCLPAQSQVLVHGVGAPRLIAQAVDENQLVRLVGNTRPEATALNDRGIVADSLPMQHMLLQLRRSPAQEQALDQLIDQLHDPKSANYHQWLTAAQYGSRFGLAQQDLDTIATWLRGQGFAVNAVYPSGVLIDFSGNAGQVRQAFHTEIHAISVNGQPHIANMSDPQIPEALAQAVSGILSLHDFKPRTMHKPRAEFTISGGSALALAPADLATIYNLNPLFSSGISGQGQTVVVIEDTDVYSTSDWTTFRDTFGLSTSFPAGSFITVHPAGSGANNCSDPGSNGDDGEAILDAEWASAAAPSATIEMASCDDTSSFGGAIALTNLLNDSTTPPAIVSISYGFCEAESGAGGNAFWISTDQQAVAEGVSVFVSSGDEGAASCDADETAATHGIGVSGFTTTPYNVSVGGTDFGDAATGTTATYWNAGNTATFGSAKSYIPEIPWNSSCASELFASYFGFATTYGSSGFCNDTTTGEKYFLTTAAGSGGPSGCASGSPGTTGVVGSTCAGTPKPSWQTGVVGIPNDGVRDVPDVSLFAANGAWGHYYVYCWSDPSQSADGSAPCTGDPSGWSGAGGTSFASPIMAAIQSLVNQSTGERQGNPNPVYYQLAAAEYGASGNPSCNSSNAGGAASSCVFYDVTQGDMDLPCTGSHNCYRPSGTHGVLTSTKGAYDPAYAAATGWDFATGLGTINAANLVAAWPGGLSAPTGLTATAGAGQVSLKWTASSGATSYNVYEGTAPNSENATAVKTGITATSTVVTGLSDGTSYYFVVKAVGSGGTTSPASNEANAKPVDVSVSPTSIAFGQIQLGSTSGAKSVVLINHQTSAISLATAISGSGFAISATTCGSTLGVSKSCSVSVTYAPTISGRATGTLTVTDSPDSSSPHSISLAATGIGLPTVTPASVSFGTVAVGSPSRAVRVEITNNEASAISILNSVSGPGFAITTTNCSANLAAFKSCTATVVLTPTASGHISGSLTVTDSPDSGSPHAVPLQGTGK
jgi:subtilase family serine protease